MAGRPWGPDMPGCGNSLEQCQWVDSGDGGGLGVSQRGALRFPVGSSVAAFEEGGS